MRVKTSPFSEPRLRARTSRLEGVGFIMNQQHAVVHHVTMVTLEFSNEMSFSFV
jgi:hypothetical protein